MTRFSKTCLMCCLLPWMYLHGLAQWQSDLVHILPDSSLEYLVDAEGNRIPDLSHAGYKGGGVALPDVPTVQTLQPTFPTLKSKSIILQTVDNQLDI